MLYILAADPLAIAEVRRPRLKFSVDGGAISDGLFAETKGPVAGYGCGM